MEIKKRDMKLTGFHEGCKQYYSKRITEGNLSGVASIIKFTNIDNKTEVNYNFKHEIIVDNNYTWLQIAFENENYFIKAMYNEKDNLVEVYIDVSKENNFSDISNPYYLDLFLDIVVPAKGHIYHMDDIELMKAYNEGIITKKEYATAKKVCKKLEEYLEENRDEFLKYLWRLKEELSYELDNLG